MATIYLCDRCGVEQRIRDEVAVITYPIVTGNPTYAKVSQESGNWDSRDLCCKCCKELYDFMQKKPLAGGL